VVLESNRNQGIALLGPYGSGKTTILNFALADIADSNELLVIPAQFNCWAIREPEDAPRIALQCITDALEAFVDVQGLRGLPDAYQRLVAAEPSGMLTKILGERGATDPVEELTRLSPMLEAIGARLLLIVEDAERAGPQFETRHLDRLLWTLREVPRVSFVLSFDPSHGQLDYTKLCDVIELVPPVNPEHVQRLLMVAYGNWSNAYATDRLPGGQRASRLDLAGPEGDLAEYVRRSYQNSPAYAITDLVKSPRRLKHLVRRVNRVWTNLHGEVDLDDVIVLSALREGAPEVFDFLVQNIDLARQESSEMRPRVEKVKKDWETLRGGLDYPERIQSLVDTLGLWQLSSRPGFSSSRQGVHLGAPTDYLRRILAEQIGPGELRDQEVLMDIAAWRESRADEMPRKLLACTEEAHKYADVWGYFADKLSESELLELASAFIRAEATERGAEGSIKRPCVLAVWPLLNRRLERDKHENWLSEQIRSVLPHSLILANDLYDYFASVQHGIVSPEGMNRVRRSVLESARITFINSESLLHALSPSGPFEVAHLVTPVHVYRGEQPDVTSHADWTWISTIILEAARIAPELMAPQIAALVGKFGDLFTAEGKPSSRYSIDEAKLNDLFGERAREVLEVLAVSPPSGPDFAPDVAAQAKTLIENTNTPE
jgi:vacuolar-type H+-ATPase catalytic subunit A/Vma1